MLPYLYLLLAMQAFCLYHAYQNRTEQKWYYMIIFIPYVGCFLYLFDAFYTRRSVAEVTEVFKQVVNSNYRIEELEKEEQFNNSATNSMRLADAYVEAGRFNEAAAMYDSCREGFMADDESLNRKLLHAWYLAGQYEKCVELGSELTKVKSFRNSNERLSFSWALHKVGKGDEARHNFEDMNKSFTNYPQRLSYCEFLIATNNMPAAKSLAGELAAEFEMMKGPERRLYRDNIRQVEDLQQSLGK